MVLIFHVHVWFSDSFLKIFGGGESHENNAQITAVICTNIQIVTRPLQINILWYLWIEIYQYGMISRMNM